MVHRESIDNDLLEELRDLRTRVRALENTARVGQTLKLRVADSVAAGGDFNEYKHTFEAGQLTQRGLGSVDTYGIKVYDPTVSNQSGTRLWIDAASGLAVPRLAYPWRPSGTETLASDGQYKEITNGTAAASWRTWVNEIAGDAFETQFTVETGNASTNIEVFVRRNSTDTATLTLPGSSATSWTVSVKWQHGGTIGTGPHAVYVQTRRSAGTGTGRCYWPEPLATAATVRMTEIYTSASAGTFTNGSGFEVRQGDGIRATAT